MTRRRSPWYRWRVTEVTINVEMDPDWERALSEAAQPGLRELAERLTRRFDDLIARHRGGDMDTVRSELVRIFGAEGGHIAEPELSRYAEAIVAGQRIVVVLDSPTRG